MKDNLADSYCLFGMEALRERLPAVTQEMDGVRAAADIEYVHRMRVASRRVRNVLALFDHCLPKKHFNAWRIEMRRVTRALGAARDTDVQVAVVEDFLQGTPDESLRPGLQRLLLRLRQQRAAAQRQVDKALDRLNDKRIIDDMNDTLHELILRTRVYEREPQSGDLYLRADEAIRLRLEELWMYEPFVRRPDCVDELHQMRIAAKHVRYTLEVFAPLYDNGLKKPIKVVKEIQELLGEVHDCDVWAEFLPQFIAEERARTEEYFGDAGAVHELVPGVEALAEERRLQRLKSYYTFARFWELAQEQDVWGKLRQTIQPHEEDINEAAHEGS